MKIQTCSMRSWAALRCLCLVILATLAIPGVAFAGFECAGPLTDPQRRGFEAIFSPPYSPSLKHQGGPVAPENMAKVLTDAQIKAMQKNTPALVKSVTLDQSQANSLKGWLNASAQASVPGWLSTAVGITAPQAWVGVAADVFLQLVNGAGDEGRLKLANLAGLVSSGGQVGILEQVWPDKAGKLKFLWTYVYKATLNNKLVTTMLTACSADVVKQP
jgi:hypothetical protein